MNPAAFFNVIRTSLFDGALAQWQVDGINAMIDAWFVYGDGDARKLAYILATSYHETGRTMTPVGEVGKGRGKLYGQPDPKTGQTYYGRGHVQLTWHDNYVRAGNILGVDLVNKPELALDMVISAKVIVRGMLDGWFTGKRLISYFNDHGADPVDARRIVNGMDKAELIAGYYKSFYFALTA